MFLTMFLTQRQRNVGLNVFFQFEIALSLVHEIQRGCEDELPREGTVKEKMIFSPQNIVTWTTVADMDAVTKSNDKR